MSNPIYATKLFGMVVDKHNYQPINNSLIINEIGDSLYSDSAGQFEIETNNSVHLTISKHNYRLLEIVFSLDNNIINFSKSYVSPGHEWLDFTKGQIKNIEKEQKRKMYGRLARDERKSTNGLLLIYPIYGSTLSSNNTKSASNSVVNSYGLDYDFPIIAPAISFSGKAIDSEEEYIVDSETLKQLELEF